MSRIAFCLILGALFGLGACRAQEGSPPASSDSTQVLQRPDSLLDALRADSVGAVMDTFVVGQRPEDEVEPPVVVAPPVITNPRAVIDPRAVTDPQVVPDTVVVADTTLSDVEQAILARLDSLQREMARLSTALAERGERQGGLRGVLGGRAEEAGTDTTLARAPADILEKGRSYFTSVLLAAFLLFLIYGIIKALVWILEISAERSATRRLFFKKLIPVIRILMWIFAIYVIIAEIFQLGGSDLLAAGAAIGVAIGFAAQDILKNIFGGILIILDQPFQVGDKINVGGTYGEVVSIGLRSTRIVTPDDNLVTVPNAQVVEGQVANANAGALDCQVVTDLYLPGWVDVMKAKAIAYQAAANSKYVYLDKPIVVIVKDEFKETFLTHLKVKAYVLDTRYESVFASDVTEMAKAEFLREGMLWPVWGLDHLALPGNGEAIADKPTGES